MVAVIAVAGLLLHELIHSIGYVSGTGHTHNPDPTCNRAQMIQTAFVWAMAQKYEGVIRPPRADEAHWYEPGFAFSMHRVFTREFDHLRSDVEWEWEFWSCGPL